MTGQSLIPFEKLNKYKEKLNKSKEIIIILGNTKSCIKTKENGVLK